MAIASRSPTADIAKTFLGKLEIQSMFVAHEIFSSWTHKTEHFLGCPSTQCFSLMTKIGILTRSLGLTGV
ncbi:hypothetical protein C5167_038183 [Papaver somniferum]|uniref:Uncharacterized protein n=1 Tax=Papaver somniferum TaxID=3469 RepID=A0A4Y7I8H1_PAPSO|nr:hypothetical protein C5167_038183 [Papaver somniferum]